MRYNTDMLNESQDWKTKVGCINECIEAGGSSWRWALQVVVVAPLLVVTLGLVGEDTKRCRGKTAQGPTVREGVKSVSPA